MTEADDTPNADPTDEQVEALAEVLQKVDVNAYEYPENYLELARAALTHIDREWEAMRQDRDAQMQRANEAEREAERLQIVLRTIARASIGWSGSATRPNSALTRAKGKKR